jgi:hypothetical protein
MSGGSIENDLSSPRVMNAGLNTQIKRQRTSADYEYFLVIPNTYIAVSMGTWYATHGSAKRSKRCLAPAAVKAYECMHLGAQDR